MTNTKVKEHAKLFNFNSEEGHGDWKKGAKQWNSQFGPNLGLLCYAFLFNMPSMLCLPIKDTFCILHACPEMETSYLLS